MASSDQPARNSASLPHQSDPVQPLSSYPFATPLTGQETSSTQSTVVPRTNPFDTLPSHTTGQSAQPSIGSFGSPHIRSTSGTNPFRERLQQQQTGTVSSQTTDASTIYLLPGGAPSFFDVSVPQTNPFYPAPALPPRSVSANPWNREPLSSSQDYRTSDKYTVVSPGVNLAASRSFDDFGRSSRPDSNSPYRASRSLSLQPSQSNAREMANEWEFISFDPPLLPHRPQESGILNAEGEYQADAPVKPTPQNLDLLTSPELPPRLTSLQSRPITGDTIYPVRKVKWSVDGSQVTSPILMQNANGPCPLVALVNVLVLRARNNDSGLKSFLMSQKKVNLDSLLQAIVEELITSSTMDCTLPDIGELIEFLKGLHTGLNVNPIFIAPEAAIGQAGRLGSGAGVIESSLEMEFYSAFGIPLVHGWIPPKNSPTYEAMARHATNFEAAQDLLSREDEFDERLNSTGLSPEDQDAFQGMVLIKKFLFDWSTQLTPTGIESITNSMEPGSVSILFRNDHFSTLYRHADTLQLFSLVTDSGYINHEHIVWETLVDVSGESSEFYSGDFDVVHGEPVSQDQQTDDDFALAMRLQEEESRGRSCPAPTDSRSLTSYNGASSYPAQTPYPYQTPNGLINPRGRPLDFYRNHQPLRNNFTRNPQATTNRRQEEARDGDELPSYEQAQSDRIVGQRPNLMTPGPGANGHVPMPMYNNPFRRDRSGCRQM